MRQISMLDLNLLERLHVLLEFKQEKQRTDLYRPKKYETNKKQIRRWKSYSPNTKWVVYNNLKEKDSGMIYK